ncbi:MAG: hypothetical protein OSB07_09260 [Dehalococcoidia bacterium]|nr:hypothetical protein [Dehalococcoidia bacterium]
MTLDIALILIFILMVASVPFLHMGLYRYLSGKISKGDDPD